MMTNKKRAAFLKWWRLYRLDTAKKAQERHFCKTEQLDGAFNSAYGTNLPTSTNERKLELMSISESPPHGRLKLAIRKGVGEFFLGWRRICTALLYAPSRSDQ